ncbi:MAG: glycosyltransferase [Candidatus Thermoplasmatota archaeon]|nr:glycosyltransferase [Candidatus Thermoplasmatota archaeon]MCG2827562.1 glycosyltransferase [Thermoplasmatales archaeon]
MLRENRISIVIPAYNEERRIKRTLEDYYSFLSQKYRHYELIVVCDGCVDKTPMIVKDFSKKHQGIKLLEFPSRLGKGGGLIKGFMEADCEIIGFVDADEAVHSSEYEKLILTIENGADCAIASRRGKGAKILVKQPLKRRIASRVFNIIVRAMFGLSLQDTQCGAKVFKGKVIKKVLPDLKAKGFDVDVDLLWNIKKNNFKIKEVPITWKHETDSIFSLKYGPTMFVNLLKIRCGYGTK